MSSPMATRAAHRCCLLRSGYYPPFSASLSLRFLGSRHRHRLPSLHYNTYRFAHSLVDSVMEELKAIRDSRRVRITSKMGFPSTKELFEVKLEKRDLQKGLLLEFRKDSQKLLLGVTEKPDGKKNWMVYDQVLLETTTAAC